MLIRGQNPSASTPTAAEVPVTPAGTISSTDVQAALQELDGDIQSLSIGSCYASADWKNIKTDYGAVGDGTTDDTTAFNNAIASGNNIYIPASPYKITGALTALTTQGQQIVGAGWSRTIAPFVYAGTRIIQASTTADVFNLQCPRPSIKHLAIIREDGLATAGCGIVWGTEATARYWCNIEDLLIEYMYRGIKVLNSGNGHFENINIYRSILYGLYLRTANPNGDTKFNNVNVAAQSTGVGYYIEGADLVHFINCKALNNLSNVQINSDYAAIYNLLWNNCSFENAPTGATKPAVYVTKTTYANWGVQFVGCEYGVSAIKGGIYLGDGVTDYKLIGGEVQGFGSAPGVEMAGQDNQVIGINIRSGGSDAIKLNATASRIVLVGNVCRGNAGYGLNILGGATYVTATGNDFLGNTAGAASIASGVRATSKIAENQGIDDYLTSISSAPDFIRQEALVGGQWYKAKGTSSTADWVLIG